MATSKWSICQWTAKPFFSLAASPRALTILFVFHLALSASLGGSEALHLTGVTVLPDHPHADVLTSFFSELLAEIAEIGQFSYNLRVMPSGTKYGGAVGETQPEGLIGEVYNNLADFVIADLEITSEREKFIEFTRPFMRSKLAALVRRSSALSPLPPPSTTTGNQTGTNGAADSNKSLADNSGGGGNDETSSGTTETELPPATLRAHLQKGKRGVIRASTTEQYFRTSSNPYVYHLLPSTVPNLQAGIQLVRNTTDYVLISDSARLDLVAAHDCQVKVVTPMDGEPREIGADFTVEFGIGFLQDSPFLQQFDLALEQLELNGKLAALIEQHWSGTCTARMTANEDAFKSDGEQGAETNAASHLTPSLLWLGTLAITTLTIIRMLTRTSRHGQLIAGEWF